MHDTSPDQVVSPLYAEKNGEGIGTPGHYDVGIRPEGERQEKRAKNPCREMERGPSLPFPEGYHLFYEAANSAKMAFCHRFWNKIKPETRWDQERGGACLGKYGVVARRCSMNDKLWGIYQDSKKRGISLTLDQIKKMITIDIKRSKLYPPGWTDDTANPPDWYLDKLRTEGRLDQIFADIEQATKGV